MSSGIGSPGGPGYLLPQIGNDSGGGKKSIRKGTGSEGPGKPNGSRREREVGFPTVGKQPLSAEELRVKFPHLQSANPSSTNERVERMIKLYSNQDPARKRGCIEEMNRQGFSNEEQKAVFEALGLSKKNNFVDKLLTLVSLNPSDDGNTTRDSSVGSPDTLPSDSSGLDPLTLKDFEDDSYPDRPRNTP